MDSKTCGKCKVNKPVSEFYVDRRRDGYQAKCKNCAKAYYADNRERILAHNAEHYRDNKHLWQAHHAKYYPVNAERIKAKSAAWRKANPERSRDAVERWRVANQDRVNELSRRRTATKRGNGIYVTSIKEIRRLYASACTYCGSRDNITIDHVIPIARGGRHSIGNLVPACKTCNSSKRHRTIMEWRMSRR